MPPSRIKPTSLLVAAVLLVLAGLCARMLLGARQQVAAAARAGAAGDHRSQVRHLRRAMAYYLPGNPWVGEAHDRLLELARQAATRGHRPRALHRFRELRSAILRLRGAFQPYASTLPEVNRALASLSSGYAHGLSSADPARWRQRLAQAPEPHLGATMLALAGFCLWVGGAVLLLLRGLRPDATVIWRRLWPLALCVAAGLGLFCAGLAAA